MVAGSFDRNCEGKRANVSLANNARCKMYQSRRPPGARYRDLRNRLRRLEALYEDSFKLDRIIETGRYFKLAVTTARAYEQIEKEFDWQKMFGQGPAKDTPERPDRRRR